MLVLKILSIEEAIKYNKGLYRSLGRGCVSCRACETCGALVSDGPCMCIGLFTCPNCGQDNAANVLDWRNMQKVDSFKLGLNFYENIPRSNNHKDYPEEWNSSIWV